MIDKVSDKVEATKLLGVCCRALCSGRLRFKPRERMMALLLACESFGKGRAWGVWDIDRFWQWLRPAWRRTDVQSLLEEWRRAGWIAVDVAAGQFLLAPDRWPGWDQCRPSFVKSTSEGGVQGRLELDGGPHLGSMVAEISQHRAGVASVCGAKFAQQECLKNPSRTGHGAEISQGAHNVSGSETLTFKRSDVSTIKRLTLPSPSDTSNPSDPLTLQARVRAFVGEEDWQDPNFWNGGQGWRRRLFVEESEALAGALDFVQAGLESGEVRLRKTRGALLWNEFQRMRKKTAHRRSD